MLLSHSATNVLNPLLHCTGSRNSSDGWLVAQVKGSGCTDGPLKIMTYLPYKG